MPGFIDTHIHYPQTDIIASHGAQLLDWLNTYTFLPGAVSRMWRWRAKAPASSATRLLRNSTAGALCFATVHPQSVDAIFEAAAERNMCMLAGKVMMDRPRA